MMSYKRLHQSQEMEELGQEQDRQNQIDFQLQMIFEG